DEDRRAISSPNAGHDWKFLRRERADTGNHDLSSVCVTGKHNRNLQPGSFIEPAWIMGQEDDGSRCSLHQRGDVGGAPGPEPDADQVPGPSTTHDCCPAVLHI